MKNFIMLILGIVLLSSLLTINVYAETQNPSYGCYENENEISAKDRIIPDVNNIFDYENSPNANGEKIDYGRYYIETKYKGGYNGIDPDYIYLDEIMGQDGIDGKDGINGEQGETGDKGDTGEQGIQGEKGDKGKQGEKGDIGLQGEKGQNGIDGINGTNGERGEKGDTGLLDEETLNEITQNITNIDNLTDVNKKKVIDNSKRLDDHENRLGDLEQTQVVVEGQIRIQDSKKLQTKPFVRYNFTRNKIDLYGVKVIYKWGKSYEEKRIEELENRLEQLLKN